MTYRLPYPLPNQWEPQGPYRNPGGTNPLPPPSNIPYPCWFGGRIVGDWQTDADSALTFSFTWRSPIIDMRPDIRGLTANNAGSSPTKVSAVPMWNPSAKLYLQVEAPSTAGGLLGVDLRGVEVIATERAHVSDPNLVSTVSEPQDISEEFSVTGASVILGWSPYGDGIPVRYYQLDVKFQIRANMGSGGNPSLTLTPAMY